MSSEFCPSQFASYISIYHVLYLLLIDFLFLESRFSVDISMLNAALLLPGRSKGSLIQGYSAVQYFCFVSWLRFFSIDAN